MFKKLLTLAAFMAVGVGWGNLAHAQTDVTDTYLQNANLDGDNTRFLDINTDRGVEKPLGWSVEWYQDNSDKNGMTFVAESMTQDGKTWNAKSGKSYFVRMRWGNATFYLRQTLQNLRPGSYTLSFSAVGHSTNNGNSAQVTIAGQTQSIVSGSVDNADGAWTDYSISFTITESTPYATIEFKVNRAGDLLKVGIDNFVLTYDGSSYYETILAKAQALYDDNAEWAENGLNDFAAAITANTGKATIEEKNTAIVALEEAMATFKAANSVDMTAKIANPNFDSNIDGWTCTGGDGNGYQRQTSAQTNFTGGFLEKWRNGSTGTNNQKDFDVSQALSNLPNGEYTVKAYILAQMQGGKETLGSNYKDKKHGGPYYIDDEKGVWFYATSGEATANTWANSFTPSFGDTGGGVLRSATINVENGSLTIGFKGIGSPDGGTQLGTYANWIACDTWTLSYFGFDPTTLKAQIEALQGEATTLLGNSAYANVVGSERTTLTTASTLTPADEKKSTLETVVAQIEAAINAFTTAKTNYDALASEIYMATELGMDASAYAATSESTAATLPTNIENLKVAEYTYITTTYTESATLGDWTEDFGGDLNGEGYVANGPTYFDQWNGSETTRSAKQTVTLPAGSYAISCIARGAIGTSGYLYYKVAGSDVISGSADFNMKGNSGKGVDTSGAANFSNEGTYTNNGVGFGWEYRFITFTLNEETTIEIGLEASIAAGTWVSFYAPELFTTEASIKALRLSEIAEALATVPTGDMNKDVKATLDTKKAAADGASLENTKEELNTILDELNAAIAAANTSIANYAAAKAYLDLSSTFDDDGKASYTADATVAEVKSAYDGATLVALTSEQAAAMDAAIRVAAKAQTTPGADMTLAIVNPTIDGDNGWNTERRVSGNGPLKDGIYFEYWGYTIGMGDFDYYQTIEGLPAGKYTVSADMYNAFNAQEIVDFVPGAGVYGTSAETKIAPVTEEGAVWKTYTTEPIIVTNGTLRIGIKNSNADNTMPARWVAADNFKLTFVEAITLQDYYNEIDALVATAEAITGRQSATTETALTTAINNGKTASGHETDLDAIEAVIEALTTAIANSNASIAAYQIITAGVIPTNNAAGWEKDTPEGGLACNTWSSEANTDGSGMTTPFIQVHRDSKAGPLGAGRLYYTISNLEPGEKFVVSARARVYNEAAGSLDGGSFFVNETKVDIDEKGIACAGDYANKGIYGVFYAVGTVDTEGKLQFGIEVAEGSELNWIAIKDVTIKDFTDTKLSEITVSPNAPTMTTGTTMTLTATVTPADADDPTVMWTSSDPTVATVNNAGFVTALKAGTTTITVTANDGGAEATTEITVADATAPAFYATEIATATDYYIVNAATGKFLGGGNNYGTRASLIEHGIPFTITKEESGKYTLDSHVYNNANSHYFRGDYVDQTSKDNIYITPMEGGRFSISTAENAKYVTAAAGNTIVADNAADAISSLAQWYFVTKEDMENALVAATAENPLDATFYIGDPNFSRNMLIDKMQNGQTTTYYEESYPWTIEASNFNLKGGDQPNFCAESYHSAFTLSQELTVPNGTYKLRAQAASNGNNEDVFIYATAGETTITTPFNAMVNGESSMSAMSAQFSAGNYYTDWIEVTVTDHKLTIGAKTERTDTWCIWDNFELYVTDYITEVTMKILVANKYGTFVAPFDVEIPQDVKAYTVMGVNVKNELELNEVTGTIPANTPVIIYKDVFTAEEVENEVFTETFQGKSVIADSEMEGTNLLIGVYYKQPAPVDSYVLQNKIGKVAFYQVKEGGQPKMRAYSAYLWLEESNGAKSLSFGDDEATAIAGIEALTSGNMEGIYTTSGAKVNSLQKGVNIIRTKDGKSMKVYVK